MSEMTYKQAIKILSEAKVADMPYKGCNDNHKMYDIARRMAIEALKEKAAVEEFDKSTKDLSAREPVALNADGKIQFQVGDIIPFKTRTGYVVHYIVEKIKIKDDGIVKIRCKHGGGGQSRSFLLGEAKALVRSGGLHLR